jgi:hypothetical protein
MVNYDVYGTWCALMFTKPLSRGGSVFWYTKIKYFLVFKNPVGVIGVALAILGGKVAGLGARALTGGGDCLSPDSGDFTSGFSSFC